MTKFLWIATCVLTGTGLASAASFTQCPAVGFDTNGCELLITVTAVNGAGLATAFSVALASPDQGPYDGSDDTLIGIVNSSGNILRSLNLTASAAGTGAFDFEGDGACSVIDCSTNWTGSDSTGYGHLAGTGTFAQQVSATFTNIHTVSITNDSGTVLFGAPATTALAGLANGANDWFSLEGPLSSSQLVTPEPGSLLLLGTGLLGLLAARRRRCVR